MGHGEANLELTLKILAHSQRQLQATLLQLTAEVAAPELLPTADFAEHVTRIPRVRPVFIPCAHVAIRIAAAAAAAAER